MSGYREHRPPGYEKTNDLRTWESSHKCPRCACELYCGEKDGIEIQACGRCGGVWLHNEHAKRALATGSRAHEELAKKVEKVTRAVPWKDTPFIRCPECDAPMHRKSIGQIVVDLCEHGTWFDRTELVAVMRFMRGEPPEEARVGVEAAFLKEHADRKKWGWLVGVVELFSELLPNAGAPKK
jgi:Zn-finger nucleic acid-binding protein